MITQPQNIRFNEEMHDLFADELKDAIGRLAAIETMFLTCYPKSATGAEGRVRRNLNSALHSLQGVRMAAENLRADEAL